MLGILLMSTRPVWQDGTFQTQRVGNGMTYFRGYEESHEEEMRRYFRSLPEDHRRRYAAVEARKIGFGGARVGWAAKPNFLTPRGKLRTLNWRTNGDVGPIGPTYAS